MTSTSRDNSWGPYRPTLEDQLAACADYLDRLQRSLAGEIAPDRHYFNDKAYQLHEVARRLVRRGQEIERWLRSCDATVEHSEDGRVVVGTCERPAGHTGAHADNPAREPAEQLCHNARALADLSEQASHRLGVLAPDIDQRRAIGVPVAPEDPDSLRDVASTLDQAGREAQRLAQRVRDLATSDQTRLADTATSRLGVHMSSRGPDVGL
jgi:hypothetical protein